MIKVPKTSFEESYHLFLIRKYFIKPVERDLFVENALDFLSVVEVKHAGFAPSA